MTTRSEQRHHHGVDRDDEVCNKGLHGWDEGSGDKNDDQRCKDDDNSKYIPTSGVSKSHDEHSREQSKMKGPSPLNADIEFILDDVDTDGA